MSAQRPSEPRRQLRKPLMQRVSLVWLLPVLAIGCALYMLWFSFMDRGPLVRIAFEEAGGVIAGETRIRRNDVDVGTVEAVRLSDDLNSVIIEARLDPMVEPFIDTDTRFWIVKARVNTTEISGLSTLLSGSYIGIDWDDVEGNSQRDFVGLEETPMTARGTDGRRLTLSSEEAGYIYEGSPVFFRQLEIGKVERRRLSGDATEVLFDVFIEAPYHEHLYTDSRFFSVTGLDASFGADGISVHVESIAAFFTGGIAFENPGRLDGLEPVVSDGARFRLYDGRKAAQDSIFEGDEDKRFRFLARFDGSIKGLSRDAPVEYNGIRVGRVAEVSMNMPEVAGGSPQAIAILQLEPRRLGLDSESFETLVDGLDTLIDSGLRIQLATGNFLTGSLVARFVIDPEAPVAELDRDAKPFPEIPTIESDIEAVTQDVELLVSKLSNLPFRDLIESATGLFADFRALVASPEMGDLPGKLASSLDSLLRTAQGFESASSGLPELINALTTASRNADDVLDGVSPDSEIYVELSAAVRELRIAARSIAGFAEILEENPNAVLTGRR